MRRTEPTLTKTHTRRAQFAMESVRAAVPDTVDQLLVLLCDQDVGQRLGQTVHIPLSGVLLEHLKQLFLHIWLLPQHFFHLVGKETHGHESTGEKKKKKHESTRKVSDALSC